MYFLTGNLWLLVGFVLLLGKTQMPFTGQYSFFGSGAWLDLMTYHKFVGFALGAAAVSFALAFRNRNKAA